MRKLLLIGCLCLLPGLAQAEDETLEHGTLNPEEMSLNTVMQKALRGEVDMVTCA